MPLAGIEPAQSAIEMIVIRVFPLARLLRDVPEKAEGFPSTLQVVSSDSSVRQGLSPVGSSRGVYQLKLATDKRCSLSLA